MKTNTKQPESAGQAKAGTPETKLVRLEFSHPTACSVCIAGTFNDWHPGVTEMMALGDGRWAKELALPPGTYEYRLVADGEWMSNPAATESMANPFGGMNSVLRVAAHSAMAS